MWTKFGAAVLLLGIASSTGADAAYTATKIYSSGCGGPPDAVTLAPGGSCVEASCSGGEATSCNVEDADEYLLDAFGYPNPYVYFKVYDDSACTHELSVFGARLFEGNCVQFDDKSKSYVVGTDGSVQERSYATIDCKGDATVEQWTSTDVVGNKCVDKVKVFKSQQPADDVYIVTTYFTDSTCKTPNRIDTYDADPGDVVEAKTCAKDINGLYYSSDKDLISDVFAYAKTIFGAQTTYVIHEFIHGSDCMSNEGWVVYRADSECINMSQRSTIESRKVAIDSDGSLTIRTYASGGTCTGESEDVRVAKSALNGRVCDGDRYYVHSAEAPAPTTTAPTPTTTAPTPTTTAPAPTQSANVRQSSSNVIAMSIAVIATLMAAVVASAFMA